MRCKVDAKVRLSGELSLNTVMTFNSEWELIEESRPIPEEFIETKPWGPVDLTGTSSAILYSTTVILGIVFYIQAKIKKMFLSKYIRRGHCFISLVTLMFVLAHMSTAMQKDWPWESPGMRFAQLASIGLVAFTIFGFFDVEIIKEFGRKKWRLIHIALTLMLGAFIIFHFGLMGDHLGFLR